MDFQTGKLVLQVLERVNRELGTTIAVITHNAGIAGNEVFIRQGRYIEPGRGNEVLVSQAFAEANKLQLGDSIGAIIRRD